MRNDAQTIARYLIEIRLGVFLNPIFINKKVYLYVIFKKSQCNRSHEKNTNRYTQPRMAPCHTNPAWTSKFIGHHQTHCATSGRGCVNRGPRTEP
jgi:hypothetical protein